LTAIKEAFRRAGVENPEDRLIDIAVDAMVRHADSTEDAVDAVWRKVSRDLTLMVPLFEREKDRVIGALFHRARNIIAYKNSKGELTRKVERRAAELVTAIRGEEDRRLKLVRAQEKRENDAATEEWLERMAAWKRTPIGDVVINDLPVWKVTPGTARTWADTEGRRARCVRLLAEGLPDVGLPIEHYRRPEDVAELWKVAAE
jgi:hypothetical protein